MWGIILFKIFEKSVERHKGQRTLNIEEWYSRKIHNFPSQRRFEIIVNFHSPRKIVQVCL